MSLIAPHQDYTEREPIPEDVYVACLYSFIDVGTQTSKNPQYDDKRQVILTWEIPAIMKVWQEDGPEEPASISAFYNFSMFTSKKGSKSNLLKVVNGWRGKELTAEQAATFDFENLLAKWCQLQVIHHIKESGDTIAKVAGVMKMIKGIEHPDSLHNPAVIWSVNQLDPGNDLLMQLPQVPEWQEKIIIKSQEFQAMLNQQKQAANWEVPDDDKAPWTQQKQALGGWGKWKVPDDNDPLD